VARDADAEEVRGYVEIALLLPLVLLVCVVGVWIEHPTHHSLRDGNHYVYANGECFTHGNDHIQ
jgi:hypothetical protein